MAEIRWRRRDKAARGFCSSGGLPRSDTTNGFRRCVGHVAIYPRGHIELDGAKDLKQMPRLLGKCFLFLAIAL
jgi:hypothetical protein